MAWVCRSLPCFALPAAESPSTIKISDTVGSREAQSANFPGRMVDVKRVFRRTISRAARAAIDACCASHAFSKMASRTSGLKSRSLVNSAERMASTAGRTSGFPSRPFVCPSNSGSVTDTEIMAVRPSRMNSPGRLGVPSFTFPILLAAWLIVRVRHALRPSTWEPPSRVRMLLQNERMDSVYMSADHRRATDTLTGGEPASRTLVPEHKMVVPSSDSESAAGFAPLLVFVDFSAGEPFPNNGCFD